MIRIAIYGKGGIGKSTVCSNVAAALSEQGLKVMQIGCDPKADSTMTLMGGERIDTVLSLVWGGASPSLSELVHMGDGGVLCVEAGGPPPGQGCAGRGIINALEKLEELGAYEEYKPDVILYDVLGDVVCGGFTMPMRDGYADVVYVVTSGEKMAVYAAANIAMALSRFSMRGYASLGGFILNKRNVRDEEANVEALARDFDSEIVEILPRSETVQEAEELQRSVLTAFPESDMAHAYRRLAEHLLTKARILTEDRNKACE